MRRPTMKNRYALFAVLMLTALLYGCVTKSPGTKPRPESQIYQFDEPLRYDDGSIELFRIGNVSFKWAAMTRTTSKGIRDGSNTNEMDKMIAESTQAIQQDMNNSIAYIRRAGLLYERDNPGDLDLAIIDCNMALKLNPKEMLTYYVRGLIYAKQGEYDSAISDLYTILNSNQYNVIGVRYILGQLYHQQGEIALAIDAFEQVYRTDPEFADVTAVLDALRRRQ
jgi:tetratricopeptide (TPR) repeat protein